MEHSIKTGIAFGLTSGVITTLGLMVGLNSGTHSSIAVIGGVTTIAVADAFSDALGIHISEESENVHTAKEIWTSTLSTFFSKFLCASTFLIPFFFLSLNKAIMINIGWGYLVMCMLSFWIARTQNRKFIPIVAEHLVVMTLVILATHTLGDWVSTWIK